MIDIHTHILPGVDDGPETMEESLSIAEKAVGDGVKTIVATPHVLDGPSEKYWKNVRKSFNNFKINLTQKKINIDIILGAELFIAPDLPQKILKNKELTINKGNRYVLIEFPIQEIPSYTDQTVFELFLQNIVPILAHPERCLDIQEDPHKLFDLVKKGVLTQVNSGSLIGRYGKKVRKTAKYLLAHNLVHMVGSDVHSIGNGSYPLIQGLDIVDKLVDPNAAKEMGRFLPEKVINGRKIDIPTPRYSARTFTRTLIWKLLQPIKRSVVNLTN